MEFELNESDILFFKEISKRPSDMYLEDYHKCLLISKIIAIKLKTLDNIKEFENPIYGSGAYPAKRHYEIVPEIDIVYQTGWRFSFCCDLAKEYLIQIRDEKLNTLI